MLNQQRLHTAEAISDEIEEYCEAMEEFNKDAKEPLGFASPVVGKGVPYNIGEGGTKGKGNMHWGLGLQPQRGEQRTFGDHCNWCWRSGHKEAVFVQVRVRENIRSGRARCETS